MLFKKPKRNPWLSAESLVVARVKVLLRFDTGEEEWHDVKLPPATMHRGDAVDINYHAEWQDTGVPRWVEKMFAEDV